MITEAIHSLTDNKEISYDMTKIVMDEIMSGKTTDAQIAAFLTALRMHGETIENITACATVMREQCEKLNLGVDVIDIVGTGGDELFTFNISTIASFIVAAAGIPVAKHGNRSISSKCGAADLLEALGARLDLTASQNEQVLKDCGMCFLFAPQYHVSMKYVAKVRKELGIRTIFNILGPLSNPAGATLQLLGVYDENLVVPMAKVLSNLGVKRGLVVHGKEGLDEASICSDSTICEITNGVLNSYTFSPERFGFVKCKLDQLKGGNPIENAQIAHRILDGEKGPKRDIVILNAALSIYLGKENFTIEDCIDLAKGILDEGKAKEQMENFIVATNQF